MRYAWAKVAHPTDQVARLPVRRHATSKKIMFHCTLRADKHALQQILTSLSQGKHAAGHDSGAPQHR
jgi:hypothetical protein